MITVFTPTYNRAYIIDKLYKSLCQQTYNDFEWLVVDDGSTDNTESLIQSFIKENIITIRYYKQENGGKHRAINRGVRLANGELFFMVDSDDYLTREALEIIVINYDSIKNDNSFGAVNGLKCFPNGSKVGGEVSFDIIDCNYIEFRQKYKIRGDIAEIYRTSVLKEFPFPDIEGENFCSEGLIWHRIAKKYKIRFFAKKIYVCEYLNDGLSVNNIKLKSKSPQYSMLVHKQYYYDALTFKLKIKELLSYWRYFYFSDLSLITVLKDIGFFEIWAMPFAYFIHLIDKFKLKSSVGSTSDKLLNMLYSGFRKVMR